MMQDSTIQNLFQHAATPGNNNPLLRGFIGTLFDVDFFMSSQAKVYDAGGAASNDVHASMFFARDGIGVGGLASMMPAKMNAEQFGNNTGKAVKPVELIVTPVTQPDKSDPLRQRGTIGWKTTFVAKLLDVNFVVKAYHGVSA